MVGAKSTYAARRKRAGRNAKNALCSESTANSGNEDQDRLERHVVVCNSLTEVIGRRRNRRRLPLRSPRTRYDLILVVIGPAAARVTAASQQNQLLCDNLRDVPLLPLFVFPTAV